MNSKQKEFREWAYEGKYRLEKDKEGYYTSTHTQSAWEAWQARGELDGGIREVLGCLSQESSQGRR
jgi:hypothetical protein